MYKVKYIYLLLKVHRFLKGFLHLLLVPRLKFIPTFIFQWNIVTQEFNIFPLLFLQVK